MKREGANTNNFWANTNLFGEHESLESPRMPVGRWSHADLADFFGGGSCGETVSKVCTACKGLTGGQEIQQEDRNYIDDIQFITSCSTVKSPVLLWIFSRAFGSRRTFETDSRGEGMGRVGYRRALPPSIWVMLTTEYMLA